MLSPSQPMVIVRTPSRTFMRKMDDIVWSSENKYGQLKDVTHAVHQLVFDELRRSILPLCTREAREWADQKAAGHRKHALKIKDILFIIPEDSREGVERLYQHHYRISTRYTRASEACVDS